MKRLAIAVAVVATLTLGSLLAQAVEVYDIRALPNILRTYTYFTAHTLPSQYSLDVIEINIYDLSGDLVATEAGEDTYRVHWDGDNLANGVYLYTAWFYNYDNGEVDEGEFGPYTLYILK